MRRLRLVLSTCGMALTLSCTSLYYSTWEKLGKEKRELLRDNVAKAKDEQKEVSGEFKDALANLKAIYGLKGGDLEAAYDRIKSDYNDAKAKTESLKQRVERVETIGNDLFKEWESEIGDMESEEYKQKSRVRLDDTKKRFNVMLTSLQKSEKTTYPILRKLNDQVLFLKHNLNSQALGSLKGEMNKIEQDINQLQIEINRSIDESNKFIKNMDSSS